MNGRADEALGPTALATMSECLLTTNLFLTTSMTFKSPIYSHFYLALPAIVAVLSSLGMAIIIF